MFRKLLIITLLFFSFACSKKSERDFGTFDFKAWKSDRGACSGVRTKMMGELKPLTHTIVGLSENEVFDYFGRYDLELLDSRNQKAFIYFLEKGPQCETPKKPSQVATLVFRFNATHYVSEVEFMQGIP